MHYFVAPPYVSFPAGICWVPGLGGNLKEMTILPDVLSYKNNLPLNAAWYLEVLISIPTLCLLNKMAPTE